MFSDIVGFSNMMGRDEQNALEQIAKWKIVHHSFINKHRGNPVKEIGDGYLITFENCLDAVSCALDIKKRLNSEPLLKVRIGIHLAEIIFYNNDILGDGVNIASRIEQDALAGSIHLSETVYMNLKNKAEFEFLEKGLKSFKNIEAQIKIFEVNHKGLKKEKEPTHDAADLSIAPIPFKTKTKEEADLAEEILDGLYDKVSNPKGTSLLSSSRIESILKSKKDLYTELLQYRARFMLEGKISEKEDSLYISVRLISVDMSYQIASVTFEAKKTWDTAYVRELINAISGFIHTHLKK